MVFIIFAILVITILNALCAWLLLICAIMFRSLKKSIIFKYLFANAMADFTVLSFSIMCVVPLMMNINPSIRSIFTVFAFYIFRSLNVLSAFLSIAIMVQRYIFIVNQSYLFIKKTKSIIISFIVFSFFILIPFLFITLVREVERNKMAYNQSIFFNKTKAVVAQLSFFNKPFVHEFFLRFYQILNIFFIIVALIFSVLTVKEMIKLRNEYNDLRNEFVRSRIQIYRKNSVSQSKKSNKSHEHLLNNYQNLLVKQTTRKTHNKITKMIVLITIAFIIFQIAVMVLHEVYDSMELNLESYMLFYIYCNITGFIYHSATIFVFSKFDRNISYSLKRPIRFFLPFS